MTGESPDTPEDLFASMMAACDEAVAGNSPLSVSGDTGVPPELRTEMQSHLACLRLLRHHWPRSHSADTRHQPDADGLAESETRLGRFQIRRELGQGSFGRVFLAYDPKLNREVALKVPRGEGLLTPELRERFHREAKAAAGLDHPHIVQVYEAGEAGPISYIASAYCPGLTLAAWLKEQTEPVPPRLAAQLLADLADAVQHAHSRGVLHRDLKPGNVLLSFSREPSASADATLAGGSRLNDVVPKITDFGLAKIQTDGAVNVTQSGAILGTPQYMAPEQAGGCSQNVREPADLYALGAILYELLTGRPPFVADSVLEMLTQVKTLEPVSPRRLRPRLPRDLETICLKCLQKEPSKRYASAEALAGDLRRFLNGEPIDARPVGLWEQYVKWAKRKPAVAALTAGLGVVILGSVIALTALYLHAESQRKLGDFERKEAIDARKRKEESESLAKSINRFFLKDVVAAAQPKGIGLGKDVTLREALDAAVPNIGQTLGDEPVAEAGVCDAVGQAYAALGALEPALPLLQRAVALREQTLGVDHVDTISSRLELAEVTLGLGKREEAETHGRACLDAIQRIHGSNHPLAVQARLTLAGALRLSRKRVDEAHLLYQNAAELADATLDPDHPLVRRARVNVALIAIARSENAKAEMLLRSIWENDKRLGDVDSVQALLVQGKLAETLQLLNRHEEAESIFRATLEAQHRILGDEHTATYRLQGSLAITLKAMGRFQEAADLFEETIKGYQRKVPPGHVLIGWMQSHLGEALTELDRFVDAEPLLIQGYETMENNEMRDPRRSREGAERLAKLYRKWGKTNEAEPWEATAEKLKSPSKPQATSKSP